MKKLLIIGALIGISITSSSFAAPPTRLTVINQSTTPAPVLFNIAAESGKIIDAIVVQPNSSGYLQYKQLSAVLLEACELPSDYHSKSIKRIDCESLGNTLFFPANLLDPSLPLYYCGTSDQNALQQTPC